MDRVWIGQLVQVTATGAVGKVVGFNLHSSLKPIKVCLDDGKVEHYHMSHLRSIRRISE